MKKTLFLFAVAILYVSTSIAQPKLPQYGHDLNYFLPKSIMFSAGEAQLSGKFNTAIPTPKQVLGYEIGERYCDWGDVLRYSEALAAASDRISIVNLGRTYQARPFIQIVITTPENHASLENIQNDHLRLIDPVQSAQMDIRDMPLVADVTCSIHGNEASGVNAALAMAYFFAASEDAAVQQMLEKMVLLIEPGMNPDGINRFATWCNTTSGEFKLNDSNSREHKEIWPSSRSNHYWADCNRDLLMCQHPEGRVAVSHYLDWMPNLVIDLHETTGKTGRFFHSPGHPRRVHPYIPQENQSLTGEIGAYVGKALEPIGAKPYSGKGYDDLYLGKGAAYGDVQGSVCLLYENPNTRNHITTYQSGVQTFPMSIRNQVAGTVAALTAGYDIREKLLDYQRDFYRKSEEAAAQSPVQGYVFHANGDKARAYRLLENLSMHRIDVYNLAQDVKVGKQTFSSDESFIIPLKQRSFYKIKAIWEKIDTSAFIDKHIYDISTWTFPLAYNVTTAEVESVDGLLGNRAELVFPQGSILGGKSDKAYIIDAEALYSNNMLRALLEKGVKVGIARKPFKLAGESMECGSAVVEVEGQPVSADEIYAILDEASKENGVNVYAADNKLKTDKLELSEARLPKVALITGSGMSSSATGEVWCLLERHFGIGPARLETNSFSSKKPKLDKYNVIIAADGNMSSSKGLDNLRKWVENGGTLITTQSAYHLANNAGLTQIKTVPVPKKAEKIKGVIVNASIDTKTPLCYGYTTDKLPLMKRARTAYDETATVCDFIPARYTAKPYLSGCISQSSLDRFASTPAALVIKCGKGRVIHFADDLAFRMYWYGGTKMLMNAIYFGHLY